MPKFRITWPRRSGKNSFEKWVAKEMEKKLEQVNEDFFKDWERHFILGKSGGGCRKECCFCNEKTE